MPGIWLTLFIWSSKKLQEVRNLGNLAQRPCIVPGSISEMWQSQDKTLEGSHPELEFLVNQEAAPSKAVLRVLKHSVILNRARHQLVWQEPLKFICTSLSLTDPLLRTTAVFFYKNTTLWPSRQCGSCPLWEPLLRKSCEPWKDVHYFSNKHLKIS